MKKLRITVNQKVYDVVVEVIEDDEQHAAPPLPYPGSNAAQPVQSISAAPTAARPPGRTGGTPDVVTAPIAGTVQKVFADVGSKVEAKAPLVMLDAMKMDTYIYAPRTGIVAEVAVKPGETVVVGDLLVRYEPEG